jgi:uncharacterized protein
MTLPTIEFARQRAYPPRVSAFTEPYWNALSDGRLITTFCTRCNKPTFVPKPMCPHCWHDEMRWADLCTTGTLYSWTRVYSAPSAFVEEAPFTLGIVDLDIGLRLACRLHGTEQREIAPGMPVRMAVLRYLDGPMLAALPG